MLRIVFLLLCPTLAFSQQSNADFATVDKHAITVRCKNDLTALTNELTNPYSEQLFKARAIFKWITETIEYDYKFYNEYNGKDETPNTFKCKDNKDCAAKRMEWEIKYVDDVLRKSKAVCQGYAMLFKKMCNVAGLKSEIIPGYVRTEKYQVGTMGRLNHAWNAVWIDTACYLLDPTWAAGGCGKDEDGKLLFFKKNFNNYYWLTPADEFARNHYPKDSKWTLLSNYTKDSFAANPYYSPNEIENIKLITPASGIITGKKGDTIRFKVDYKGRFQDLQINSNVFRNPDVWTYERVSKRKQIRHPDTFAIKKQQYVKYTSIGTVYEFQYVITDNSLYYLEILFDKQPIMRFKVNTNK